MDTKTLAHTYNELIEMDEFRNWGSDFRSKEANGWEIAEGWFNLQNRWGQSKIALLHEPTNLVFKRSYGNERFTRSGVYIGKVRHNGVAYDVRIPHFQVFDDLKVAAQEYIATNEHTCDNGYCQLAKDLISATNYGDCHCGNWSLYNGEIVLFDFD